MKCSLVALFVACLAAVSESKDLRKKRKEPENRYYLSDNAEVKTSMEIPAGGDRVLDITYNLRSGEIEPLCLPDEYIHWYRRCEVEKPEPDCVVLKSCPSDCEAADGTRHELGDAWSEGDNSCRCSYPGSVYFEGMPPIPPGGEPYPPVNDCKLDGCRNYMSDTVMAEGDSFERDDGSRCTCMPGTDPGLMDSYTLFHLQCQAPEIKIEEPVLKELTLEPEVAEPEEETADTTEAESTEPETVEAAEPDAPVETAVTTEEEPATDTEEEAPAEAPKAGEEAPVEEDKTTVERAVEDPIVAQADAEIAAAMAEQAAVPNPQV